MDLDDPPVRGFLDRGRSILRAVPMLESMPSLEIAKVRFDHFYNDRCDNGRLDDCGDAACDGCYYYYGLDDYNCVFLEGLTEATDLKLSAYPDLVCSQLPSWYSVLELC